MSPTPSKATQQAPSHADAPVPAFPPFAAREPLPAVLTIAEAAQILRIGRSAAYQAARCGDLPTIRVGRCLRVPGPRLAAMLGVEACGHSVDIAEKDAGLQDVSDGTELDVLTRERR